MTTDGPYRNGDLHANLHAQNAYTCGMQFLFVDSNLFLQCRPLQDLDWDRLVGREEVTILVPSAVLAELDKQGFRVQWNGKPG